MNESSSGETRTPRTISQGGVRNKEDNRREKKEYARIIAQAWVDEEFKKRLLADPAIVLKDNGIEIPEGMTVKVVEEKENEIYIPLPPKPKVTVGAEELMERVQAFSLCTTA